MIWTVIWITSNFNYTSVTQNLPFVKLSLPHMAGLSWHAFWGFFCGFFDWLEQTEALILTEAASVSQTYKGKVFIKCCLFPV